MDELMIKVVGVNLTSGFGLFGESLSLSLSSLFYLSLVAVNVLV